MQRSCVCFFVALSCFWHSHAAYAQGTAFTYQGQLMDAGQPANGLYDMEFSVHKAAVGGPMVGQPLVNPSVAVSNGLFTAVLDFGETVFTGPSRYLQIAVRSNSAPNPRYALSPRQLVTAAPYAMRAGNVTGPINGYQIEFGTRSHRTAKAVGATGKLRMAAHCAASSAAGK